jgi:hypothetical protein
MTGFTDRVSQGILNHITGKSAIFTLPVAYIGLFTATGTDAGTGFTEVTGGSYARRSTVAADWAAASGSGPSTITNSTSLAFVTATADWGIVIAFGLFDALTSGNLLAWDFLGNYLWRPATVSAASPGVLTVPAHGYAAADLVQWTIEHGGTNPTFSASNFTGALVVASPTTNTFTVTNGGTPVNTSVAGNGMVRKFTAQAIINGASATFPPASLIITSS